MSSSKQCQYCDKLFSRSFNLRRHLENGSCKMNDYASSSTEEEEFSDVDSYEDVSMESESSESDVSSESEYDSDEDADQHETERLQIFVAKLQIYCLVYPFFLFYSMTGVNRKLTL